MGTKSHQKGSIIAVSQDAKYNEHIYITGPNSWNFMFTFLTCSNASSPGCLKLHMFKLNPSSPKLTTTSLFFLSHWHQLSLIPVFKSISSTAKSISVHCFILYTKLLMTLCQFRSLSLLPWTTGLTSFQLWS